MDTDSNVLYVHSVHDVLLIVSVYTCVCMLPIVQCMYCRSVQCYHVSSRSVGEARKCCLVTMYTYCFSFWHKVYIYDAKYTSFSVWSTDKRSEYLSM